MTGTQLRNIADGREVGPPMPSKVSAGWPVWPTPEASGQTFAPPSIVLPAYKRPSRLPAIFSFMLLVVLPTLGAAYYFFMVASNQYVSEFRFTVSEVSSALPGAPPPQSTSSSTSSITQGLSSIIGSSSISPGGAQNYLVTDYIKSDQAVRDVLKTIDLYSVFAQHGVDRFSRLKRGAAFEQLASYWREMVSSDYDMVTGIAFARVKAFNPVDAQRIASRLVSLSEDLVNAIQARANKDVVLAADQEVSRTNLQLAKVRLELRSYRDKEGVIDPTQSIVPANIQQIGALESSLIALKTQLASSKQISAASPANKVIEAQINSANSELARLKAEISKSRGSSKVLSDVIGRYEALLFDVQYYQSMAMSAMQSREQAYANANAQHLFLTPYVQPSIATSSDYPHRYVSVLYSFMGFLGGWVLVILFKRGIADHV